LAAGVISATGVRRRLQLQARPQGRRIVHPPAQASAVEVGLGQRQRPLSLRTLDRGMRAIAAHCRNAGVAPPPLQLALVGRPRSSCACVSRVRAPGRFHGPWRSWLLDQADVDYLKSVPGLSEAARPGPRWSRWVATIMIG
jgi:hypothetical protein